MMSSQNRSHLDESFYNRYLEQKMNLKLFEVMRQIYVWTSHSHRCVDRHMQLATILSLFSYIFGQDVVTQRCQFITAFHV